MVHQLTENAWKKITETKGEIFGFLRMLTGSLYLTARQNVNVLQEMVKRAKQAGFQDLNAVVDAGTELKAGDKVYADNMGKATGALCNRRGTMEKECAFWAPRGFPRLD